MQKLSMKLRVVLAVAGLCLSAFLLCVPLPGVAADDQQELMRADSAAFPPGNPVAKVASEMLDPDFTWTDAAGKTRERAAIVQVLKSGNGLPRETEHGYPAGKVHIYGRVGVVQESSGHLYVLRVWEKRKESWQLLVYQAVSIGAPPAATSGTDECENPCKNVPFEAQGDDQRDVIHAYQAVERAVTAHDSAAWGAHIGDEFFAVTSNSDRPLDKAMRMAGLDNQKVGGIAPFPLASARMFQFGDAMVMTSRQQPKGGLPLHVTRVWVKRAGLWLEVFSYQTTIQ